MNISRHFKERWLERIGGPVPTARAVKRMIRGAIVLQKDSTFRTNRERYKWPAMYWVPERQLILKVDEERQIAITVITPGINRREILS